MDIVAAFCQLKLLDLSPSQFDSLTLLKLSRRKREESSSSKKKKKKILITFLSPFPSTSIDRFFLRLAEGLGVNEE